MAESSVVARARASIRSDTSNPRTCAAPAAAAQRQNQPKPQPRSTTLSPRIGGSSAWSEGHSAAPSRPSTERLSRL